MSLIASAIGLDSVRDQNHHHLYKDFSRHPCSPSPREPSHTLPTIKQPHHFSSTNQTCRHTSYSRPW
ncbi:hypothetical protein HanPI659440_Chr15g0596681 [Helianthus annuus]|nr:hypothetical protein HanPI659440_Chr15g0596681 [Helianthus annuus]